MEELPIPGWALGKFLTHKLAGENRRFFKQPGKSECVSDLCDFLTRTSIVQSKSLTTPPIRTTKDASPCTNYTVPREEDFGVRVPGPDGLFSAWMQVYNPCFKIDVFHTFKRLSTGE